MENALIALSIPIQMKMVKFALQILVIQLLIKSLILQENAKLVKSN